MGKRDEEEDEEEDDGGDESVGERKRRREKAVWLARRIRWVAGVYATVPKNICPANRRAE